MNKKQKFVLILLAIATFAYVKFAFFPSNEQLPSEEAIEVEEVQPQESEVKTDVPKSYVSVYFIGQKNNEEVYKIVKRPYNAEVDGTKIAFSIRSLLKGPLAKEKTKGIYSEIPQGTKLISIQEKPDKIMVNLSGDFEQGGGTDGLYKRLYQLIKTANKNTALDVYLELNGKQIDVIGGEGIMINQPLNSDSLNAE